MSLEAQATMQGLRNRVDTKSHGWTAFKASSFLGYKAAYDAQKKALDDAKMNIELSNERCWMVFTALFTIMSAGSSVVTESLGEWVGRLLEPAEKAPNLADELYHKTVDMMSDNAKEKIKDSIIEKRAEGASETRPWEPVVDDPETYEGKMETMLEQLAVEILGPLDDLVAKSALWSSNDASAFVLEFETSCPYVTDLPRDVGKGLEREVRKTAESAMWIEWALSRDQAWWSKQDIDGARSGNQMALLDPILDRLEWLGVPLNDVTTVQRVGSTFGNRGRRVLDMLKFVDWANRHKTHKARTWTKPQLAKAYQALAPQMRTQDQLQCYREP